MSRLWRCDVCGREGDATQDTVPYAVLAVWRPETTRSVGEDRRARLDVCRPCQAGIWATGPTDALVAALRRTWAEEYPAEAP